MPLQGIKTAQLSPPEIDEKGLFNFTSSRKDLLPKEWIVREDQLTVPIKHVSDVKALVRGVFRINAKATTPELEKKRTSVAFELLRELSELSEMLDNQKKERDEHMDRTGVAFSVGQGASLVVGCLLLIDASL